ncbi:EpsG family protein [Candidatus Margulisiibacteriota bacterium]
MKFFRKEYFIYFLLILAAVLLFTNLAGDLLWEDEAETAVIAKNILRFGWPKAFDGVNLVTQEWGHDSNAQKIWIHQTWLPHYLTALSFLVFGVSTWAARLPYVVLALITIWLMYYFIYKEKKQYSLALLAALFLTTSVTFILHARQCRYYSLLIFFAVLWLFLYWRWQNNQKKNVLLLSTVGALLFHAQYMSALAWLASTFLAGYFVQKRKVKNKEHLTIWAGIALLCLPWIIYAQLWDKFGEVGTNLSDRLINWLINIPLHLFGVNHFIFPVVLFIGIGYLFYKRKIDDFDKYIFLAGVFYYLIICFIPLYPDIRYIIVLIPWAAYFLAKIVLMLSRKSKTMAGLLVVTLIFSNIWSLPYWYISKWSLPEKIITHYKDLRFDLMNYFYELRDSAQGPVKAAVEYFEQQASPGQSVFTSYGAEPYIFYTNLKIARELPFKDPAPDWIILKGNTWQKWMKWVLFQDNLNKQASTKKYVWNYKSEKETPVIWGIRKRYIENYLSKNNYEAVRISAPDRLWENRPTLLWHDFGKTAFQKNSLVIYKKPPKQHK